MVRSRCKNSTSVLRKEPPNKKKRTDYAKSLRRHRQLPKSSKHRVRLRLKPLKHWATEQA